MGEVIAKSDYILVAAALTPSTVGMVGAAELARVSACKPTTSFKELPVSADFSIIETRLV